MITTGLDKSGNITYTFNPDEIKLLNWIITNYGTTALEQLMNDFLASRQAQCNASQHEQIAAAFRAADPVTQKSITDMLGVKL